MKKRSTEDADQKPRAIPYRVVAKPTKHPTDSRTALDAEPVFDGTAGLESPGQAMSTDYRLRWFSADG